MIKVSNQTYLLRRLPAMTVYTSPAVPAGVTWPEPVESVWQMVSTDKTRLPGYKRWDLGLADRLFIGAVVNLPPVRRPWGCITWLAQMFATSRPTVYAIGQRARTSLAARPSGRPARPPALANPAPAVRQASAVTVTPNRLARTILTLLMPGGVSGRTMEDCLHVAFDRGRSTGSISDLLHRAGQRAGEILEQVNHAPLGPVVLARDELFTGKNPNLLLVEPRSLVITGLYATTDRDAQTWACALLLTQDRQVRIQGLAEDGCIPYAASCRLAQLDAAIQKDVWHALADTRQVLTDVEREALREMTAAEKLEKRLRKHWTEAAFEPWVTLTQRAEDLLAQSAQLRFWRECLWDAVEVVDLRSGEIRDRAINQWLLEETLAGLRQLAHPRIQRLAERLEAQAAELLTFLDGLAPPLAAWRARLAQHFPDRKWAAFCQASVARLWRLEHALRSGHRQFQAATVTARHWVAELVAEDPQAQRLAEELLTLLERAVRTSCAAEAVNSVLRPYLNGRRECTDPLSRQLFLNLFALWFNLHKFDRGPRQGQSPYELAGIDVGTDDWLTLLGFPPD
jgi:hypothetical protein